MKRLAFTGSAIALALVLTLGSGCKAKAPVEAGGDAEMEQVAQKLPEGTNVVAALNQKDYETAIATLVKIQQAVGNSELQGDLMTLKTLVRSKLLEAAPTDPKANEALNGLRMMTQGR